MTAARWQEIKQVLADALEHEDAAERARFLAEACGDDAELRCEVEELLAREGASGLEKFADRAGAALGDLAGGDRASANVGRRVGTYELVRELGRGGMGAVYLARRADGRFEKEVAIKLLKRGTDTEEVLRRFRAERQILARLEHPNIARLLDGGETDDGLPYFVLEHVAGAPLNEFARAAELSLSARLELFRKVCAAVHFAHQNLVVHRDLKPRNILVTAEGEPKLLDFGIARLLAPDAGTTALFAVTAAQHQRLTPAYASPEQVRGEAITTASDVYSLGVLLYELLTGQQPHVFHGSPPSPAELLRVVGETEPTRPSLRTTEPDLRRRLRGDLDLVVLRAMAKEPARRYASASALADDLRRYLEARPVRARKDTVGYRTAKFVGRNKIGVAVAALVLLTLLGGIVAITVQRNRAERQRLRAEKGEYNGRRLLYAAQMNLAYQTWESANVGRALDLLEAERPAAGQEDLRGFEWRLLWRLAHERWRILPGSVGDGSNVVFSPDASRIAAATREGKVHIWDADTGRLLKSLDCGGVRLAFTPEGRFLVAGSADGSARLWDSEGEQLVRTFSGHKAGIAAVAVSPDAHTLATASFDGTVKLWNIETGQLLATLEGHEGPLKSAAFSPDGKLLATSGNDRTARLWDIASGAELATFRGHSWWVVATAFAPDGKTLATTGSDGEIKLWDVARRVETGTIHGDGVTINDVRFSADGQWLAAATAESTVRLYETSSWKLSDVLRGHTGRVVSVAFSPNNKALASTGEDHAARLWDLTKRPGARSLEGHQDWIWDIAFSPDGRTLASASKDATVKLWDVATGREAMTLRHPQWVNGVAFSPDGARLATADDDTFVRLWNPLTGENIVTLGGHNAVVECVTFSPDGTVLASGDKAGEIRLWETTTGRAIAALHSSEPNLIWSLAFSPDGEHLAVAEGDVSSAPKPHAITIWDVASKRVIATLPGHTNDVRTIAFSPDGTVLASGSWDSAIKLWDIRTQQEIVTLKGQLSVHSLSFSTDGKRLVSAGSDKTVKIWDVTVRQELCTLAGVSEVMSVAFSPQGETLAAGSKDGVVRLWSAVPSRNEESVAR